MVPVPINEVSRLFSVRSRRSDVSEGMWCRVKSGNYKGDLAQVRSSEMSILLNSIQFLIGNVFCRLLQ